MILINIKYLVESVGNQLLRSPTYLLSYLLALLQLMFYNVARTFLALGFPPYLTFFQGGKANQQLLKLSKLQKHIYLLAYLLSNVFNECLLFLALLVF